MKEIASLKSELSKNSEKMEIANIKADHAQMQVSDYKKELDALMVKVVEKEKEIDSVKRDLDTIGEKLVDELERRGELQHSKDALQGELEELTRSLFEEANSMVSKEARARKHFEDHQNEIQKELDSTKLQLQMEQGISTFLFRNRSIKRVKVENGKCCFRKSKA